jgi:hypothetical protein
MAMTNIDIKLEANKCIPESQAITDLTSAVLDDIAVEDWAGVQEADKKLEDEWDKVLTKEVADTCDSIVLKGLHDTYMATKGFMDLPNWEEVMKTNAETNANTIRGYVTQMEHAWNKGRYYDAGKFGGMIDLILFQAPETLMAVPNESLVFTQTSGQAVFLMDTSKTYADPSYPVKGTTAKFHVGGTWFMPETIADVEFKVMMNGTPLADIPEADAETVAPGAPWTKEFDFPIPGFAPSGTYDVVVSARDAAGTHLWDVSTSFTL